MGQTNPRIHEIWERTVAALQQVVRDLAITEDELHAAAPFFNSIGRSGLFASLIDMSLATTSVDVAARHAGTTKANLEGPLYLAGAPLRLDGNLLEREPGPGAQYLSLSGRVFDLQTGESIPGAELDFWQADQDGSYDRHGYNLRGIVVTNSDGVYHVETIVPNDYTTHDEDIIGELYRMIGRHSYRAAHIHVKVRVNGVVLLTTQFFMADSPYIQSDAVIGAVRDELVITKARLGKQNGRAAFKATFDIPVRMASRASVGGVAKSK